MGERRTGTSWIVVDPRDCEAADVRTAAEWLSRGGIVVFPTDTFYGLAVDPRSAEAVRRLFELKGRDPSVAMPLIASSTEQVAEVVGIPHGATTRLATAFWPGPLSLVFDAPPTIVEGVHGGRGTVAIRVPAHDVARAIAEAHGFPITATSANRSGEPPTTSADTLRELARDPAVMVVDAGPTPGGAPSTLVDARSGVPTCLRAGAVPWDRVLTSI